MCNKQFLK
ncbi:uncharacterized protein FRV6_09323 [Fusarium oxysporum]|uniref:Uncharacterized protein n=1 Tax=Fusarium oxysporum TaxID=5507 RepID=A0A2H3TPM0_FUSOX|nr:uncharacterized protein FRV6_09323 [Fusarium oxysporum]